MSCAATQIVENPWNFFLYMSSRTPMDEDWSTPFPFKQPQRHEETLGSPSRRRLYCEGCGGLDFQGDEDGFFYCTGCGSQSQDIIHTATADEDLLADGCLYNIHYTRARSQLQNPNPKSRDQIDLELSQALGVQSQNNNRNISDGRAAVKFVGFNDDEVSEPRDFGCGSSCSDEEKLADGIRLRYVEGLQVMLQSQCEVLVEKFGASPYIVGIVGPIWLRYVATKRVLADDWPDRVIEESEEAAEAAGCVRIGEEERPNKLKRIRPKYKSEPHNIYGQRAIYLWLRSLRKTVPLYSTLAISFLVCLIAREPILPTDIFKWASEGKLPYLTAFIDMDRCLGNASNACPLSTRALFRPNQVIGAQQLEAIAATIAQTIGLRLPSVNFYAIAHRYLKELCLPVEKILPQACRIYEWSLPPGLWLSSNVSGFPTRACVMSILIVAMRLLYNIQGQCTWEMSHSEIKNPPSNDQKVHLTPDSANLGSMPKHENANDYAKKHCSATGSEPNNKLLPVQTSDYNCHELLSILEATYHNINTAHDYSKDLLSYLKHCKDVVYANITKSYEEEKLIERLWDMYEKQEKDSAEEAKRPETSINDSLDPKKGKEDNMGEMTPVEENIAAENHPSEPFVSPNPTGAANIAIEKIKLEMEENGFEYLPPRAHQKIGYVHYRRQRIDGRLVYVAHADYYILLRACARLVEVDAQTMHRCVLGLERRLDWIDRQIDELFGNQDGGYDSRTA